MSFEQELDQLRIPLNEIEAAQKNFEDKCAIGRGTFGVVYKGSLSRKDTNMMVAVKRYDPDGNFEGSKFLNMISVHSMCRHPNLVSLVGFCDEGDENIMVTEYIGHGSLKQHLSSSHLTWVKRLQISLCVACCLRYLHDPKETGHRIIHCEVSSGSILLDEDWEARISDLELCIISPTILAMKLSNIDGAAAYMDPVYKETDFLSDKSDTYSFGVVLCELLSGRLAYDDGWDEVLKKLAQGGDSPDKLDDIIPDFLRKQMDRNSLRKFSALAYQCLQMRPEERPAINEVVTRLEEVLELQQVNGTRKTCTSFTVKWES